MRKADFKKMMIYKIYPKYLKYLNKIDSEVFYSEHYELKTKPFLGIIVSLSENVEYFIPFTSPKNKHENWSKRSKRYMFIFDEKDEVIGLLDFRKIIPVKEEFFSELNIDESFDIKYKSLIKKQLLFCRKQKNKIVENIEFVYSEQVIGKRVLKYHCDFLKLEKAMKNYLTSNQF
ncbi:type III toxin-antitoxin system ToxN/AbiQ family toxin [Mycoplasma sp. Ms02]|uniref:type III toxin-antitoxin system ToxN/AbiQ family toxin n=1 Tax=Mycoplasma sp. Ms02 TaxID=353851 RepID=UPI001C8B0877|nr:type III toxin-antitoxin system ToxN/AbiQ family toxin [Mycoplasma sp. Ms02]QZE12418.1 type III toxin-antitoxin system ToxN/AbiQ family toxin [Mycoplasma sp. Ms02]